MNKEIEQLKENIKQIVYKTDDLVRAVNTLSRNTRYLQEYNDALLFLGKFKWEDIYSEELMTETMTKLINEIPFFDQIIYCDEIKEDTLKFKNDVVDCSYTYPGYYNYNYTPNYSTNSISKSEEPVEHEYKEYVAALVEKPYEYSKIDICKVVNYLKEVLKKDEIVVKYENKEGR